MTTKELQKYKKLEIDIKKTAWNSLSAESQAAYNFDFKLFFEFINKSAKEIKADDILKYIEHLRSKNYKNASINRKIASLSKLFRIMKIAGEIKENPVDVLKQFKNISFKTNKEVKISLTIDDIKKAIKIAGKQHEKTIIFIRLLAMSGLRISEMIYIKNNDIEKHDDKNYIVRIVGKGNKERFIYIDDKFMKDIKKVFPNCNSEYLLYNKKLKPFDRRNLWAEIKNFFFVTIGKRVHPHLLRHFYATHKINTEKQDIKAVSRYLGHQSVQTTLSSYCDTALDEKSSKIKI